MCLRAGHHFAVNIYKGVVPVVGASSSVGFRAAEAMVAELANLGIQWNNVGHHNVIADMATGAHKLLTH